MIINNPSWWCVWLSFQPPYPLTKPNQSPSMAEILPFDLITIILLRLPVVDLLRCRSVSKHWRYFIDNPQFIRRHLSHSSLSRRNQTLFLRHLSSLRTVDLDSLGSSAPVLEEVNYPLMCYSDQIKLLGSCNGLICLSNAADDIIIWNPSLRKHRFLPYSNVKPRKDRGRPLLTVCVYGFGFEVKSDDYRLLRLVQFISDPCEFNISLYSLRTNKWRKIEEIPYSLVYPRKMGVFVSGALHWVMTPELVPESPNLIVGFNLEFEKFNQVPQPDTTLVSDFDMDVAVLEDCLCMVANSVAGTDVWMMKEYGSKESWVKLFSIPETIRCKRLLLPVALSDGGRQVLLRHDNKKLYSYNLQSESVTSVHIRGIPSSFDAQVCMRSLVSVDDYRDDVKKKKGGQDAMAAGRKRDDFLSVGFKLVL